MPKDLYIQPLNKEEQVLSQDKDMVVVTHVEYSHNGILMHIQRHPYPQKGLPTVQAVQALYTAKRLLMEYIKMVGKWIIVIPKQRVVASYVRICIDMLSPHFLNKEYMTPVGREVQDLCKHFLLHLGYPPLLSLQAAQLISHMVEYDAAYRFRLQDLASETTQKALLDNPQKEILRLIALNNRRDYKEVSGKVKIIGKLLLLVLWFPKYKKAFTHTMHWMNISALQFDDADVYWASKRKDYKYFGVGVQVP